MSISSIPSNTASAITPFNPLGKQTVGEEEKDSKNSSFKAVEESSKSERNTLQQEGNKNDEDEKVDAINDDGKEREEKQEQNHREEKRRQIREQEEIRELATRDREVRNHERAHAAVGGQYAGAPSYQFKRGPDGVNYAVGGEVSIETSVVHNDPQSTINKAQQIRRAALAPADPSPQDRRVAAQASQIEIQAREDLSDKRRGEIEQENAQAEQREEADAKENNNSKLKTTEESAGELQTRQVQVANHQLIAINRSYLGFDNQNNRLGSIVSEAV